MKTNTVKVKFYSEAKSDYAGRDYAYFVTHPVDLGDILLAPVAGGRTVRAQVVEINVPDNEIAPYIDKIKEINTDPEAVDRSPEAPEAMEIILDEWEEPLLEAPESPETAMITIAPEHDPRVIALIGEINSLRDWADKRIIKANADLKPATEDLALIAGLRKTLEKRRKLYLEPLKDHTAAINSAFKGIMEPLEQAEKTIKAKIMAYREGQRKQEAAEAELRRLRAEASRLEEQITGQAAEPEPPVPSVVEHAPDQVNTRAGGFDTMKYLTWELEDFAQVPDWYKKLDDGKVTKTIKAGGRIAGIRTVEKETIRINTRRD
jgi:hypothetical protein